MHLESILARGLLPGGRRSGRLHVHFGQSSEKVREGSEIIIEISTAGLFLVTPRVYKSRAGVILTPDRVSPSAFIRACVNRPRGAELWTNPRPPLEPAVTNSDLGGSSPPDPTASTPGVSSKASGAEPPPGVHSKASSSGTPPGVSSKASPPQPVTTVVDSEEEEWAANGWVPDEKWHWQWMLWKARGPDQWDDVWTLSWKLTPVDIDELHRGCFRTSDAPTNQASSSATPTTATNNDQRGSSRDTTATKDYPIPAPDDPYWTRMPTKKCPHCTPVIDIPWKVCPVCDRSLLNLPPKPNAPRRIREYTDGQAKRAHILKSEKSARRKLYNNARERLRYEPDYCRTVLADGPGRLPDSFVRFAAACLAMHQAAGVDATAVVKSHMAPYGGSSLAIQGYSSETSLMPTIVILIATVAFAFICGCHFRFCARRCHRAVSAFLNEPATPPSKPLARTVGTTSQCQYTWDNSVPRFRSENQGFRRAGEVTVDF